MFGFIDSGAPWALDGEKREREREHGRGRWEKGWHKGPEAQNLALSERLYESVYEV